MIDRDGMLERQRLSAEDSQEQYDQLRAAVRDRLTRQCEASLKGESVGIEYAANYVIQTQDWPDAFLYLLERTHIMECFHALMQTDAAKEFVEAFASEYVAGELDAVVNLEIQGEQL